MKKTFQVGDRVRCTMYGNGSVLGLYKEFAWVNWDKNEPMTVNVNQLIKLKPKPKREPRMFKVVLCKYGTVLRAVTENEGIAWAHGDGERMIFVREVIK